MTLILALGRQRQVDLSEFEVSLIYKARSRTSKDTEKPYLKRTKIKNKYKRHRVKTEKPCKDGKYIENLDTVYYSVVFELFDC